MGLINSKRNTDRDEVKFATPNGLYPTCSWDMKVVKKLIVEKKIAPFYPGSEERTSKEFDECPICFLYYSGGLNNSRCCKKGMCTECFLQIKKPNTPLSESLCPFCNRAKFTVIFTGPKSQEERQKEEEEEQSVVMLQQKIREEEIERDREREKQRQAQKGKEKAKQSESVENVQKAPGNKSAEEATEGGKGKEILKAKSKKAHAKDQGVRNKSLPGPSEAAGSAHSDRGTPSSYPPVSQGDSSSHEKDLEDLMLMEAIRLSLMESGDSAKHSAPREIDRGDKKENPNEGASSPFAELFGVEAEGNDFETRVKAGKSGIVTRVSTNTEGIDYSSGSESEKDEKEKESDGRVSARRGRTSSTTVPIEDTPLGISEEDN